MKKSSKIRKKVRHSHTNFDFKTPRYFFLLRAISPSPERERETNTHTSADKERFTTRFVFFSPPSSPSEEEHQKKNKKS